MGTWSILISSGRSSEVQASGSALKFAVTAKRPYFLLNHDVGDERHTYSSSGARHSSRLRTLPPEPQ